MLELYYCPLGGMTAELYARYVDLLSEDERVRLARFRREEVAHAFVVSRALLRTVLAKNLNTAPQQLLFLRDANDKPQLADMFACWQFNLSHCRDWVALAVSDQGSVGIDIEICNHSHNILGIAKRYFQPDEFAMLSALPEAGRADKFCELWTLKEACVKWSGLGISRALAGVGVLIDGGEITLKLREDIAPLGVPAAQLFAPAEGVRLALISAATQACRVLRCVPLLVCDTLDLQPLAQSA